MIAHHFRSETLDGTELDLANEAGKAKFVLLDFWASWCGPCRAEFPILRRLNERYKNHGLKIIGVSLDHEREAATEAATKNELSYPHCYDGGGWRNSVAVQYGVRSIPAMFLLDQQLKVVAIGLRGEVLERRLSELLGPGDMPEDSEQLNSEAPHVLGPGATGGDRAEVNSG